jgi:flagellar basal body rod protein FlgC
VSEFDLLGAAASGMEAQRAALDVAAHNVAAAEADTTAFVRLVPRFAVQPVSSDAGDLAGMLADVPEDLAFESRADFAADERAGDGSFAERAGGAGPVQFVGTSASPGADSDAITEMVAVLGAQRAYEANASVFDTGKRLMERTIDVGRV